MYNIRVGVKMDINSVKNNFSKRGFSFDYFESVDDALSFIDDLVPKNCTIGFGGSETVLEIGLLDKLRDRTLLHKALLPEENPTYLMDRMSRADWYVCSANAIAETGDIINIDGRGNRVAATVYGPQNILIVAGTNKLVPDIAAGIDRTRNVASPKNCVRLNKKTPCAVTGKCSRCNSPDTICKATVILHHPTTGKNVFLVVINKNLGY